MRVGLSLVWLAVVSLLPDFFSVDFGSELIRGAKMDSEAQVEVEQVHKLNMPPRWETCAIGKKENIDSMAWTGE